MHPRNSTYGKFAQHPKGLYAMTDTTTQDAQRYSAMEARLDDPTDAMMDAFTGTNWRRLSPSKLHAEQKDYRRFVKALHDALGLPTPEAVSVYQHKSHVDRIGQTHWVDCTREIYDTCPIAQRRVFYTPPKPASAPEAAKVPSEDEINAVLQECSELIDSGQDPFQASTYAHGVMAGIDWALGHVDEHPLHEGD